MFRRSQADHPHGSRRFGRYCLTGSILFALFLGSSACTRILTADGLTGGELDASSSYEAGDAHFGEDAAGDGGEDAYEEVDVADVGDGATPTCDPSCTTPDLVRLPCRPDVPDSESGDPIVYAVRTMRLGMAKTGVDDWMNLGLDRDCMSTTALGQPTQCVLPRPENGKDGLGGRDNSVGRNFGGLLRLMMNLGTIKSDIEPALNGDLNLGYDGWTITLEDFNHTPDDPRVTVIVRLSEGTTDELGERVEARWDGTDLWSIDPNSLSISGDPLYLDDNAFVTGRKLVARMPSGIPFEAQVDEGNVEFFINELAMVAELSEDYTQVEQGTVSGVWPLAIAVDQATEFGMRFGLCPPNPLLTTILDTIGQGADIRGDLVPAPESNCNGLSFGMAFSAEAARIGPIAPPKPEQPALCADAGTGDGGT